MSLGTAARPTCTLEWRTTKAVPQVVASCDHVLTSNRLATPPLCVSAGRGVKSTHQPKRDSYLDRTRSWDTSALWLIEHIIGCQLCCCSSIHAHMYLNIMNRKENYRVLQILGYSKLNINNVNMHWTLHSNFDITNTDITNYQLQWNKCIIVLPQWMLQYIWNKLIL